MQFKVMDSPAEFGQFRQAWNKITRESTDLRQGQDATASYEWFETLLQTFGENHVHRLIVLEQAGEPVGFLPISVDSRHAFGRTLRATELWYCGRVGLRLQKPATEHVQALRKAIDTAFPDWTDLRLNLTEGSATLELLNRANPAQLVLGKWQPSPHFSLGSDREKFWAACSKSTRQLIRTSNNKLTALGAWEIRFFSQEHQAAELLQAVLEIEQHSWKHEAGTAITRRPDQERFYRSLFPRALASGQLLGAVLFVGDKPIAHNFGMVRDGVYCCLKHSHRSDMDKCSPFYALTARLIDHLIDGRAHHFDFMGRVEPHKLRWSPDTSVYTRCEAILYRAGARGSALKAARNLKRQLGEKVAGLRSKPSATPPKQGEVTASSAPS